MKKWFILFILSLNVFAVEPYQTKSYNQTPVCDDSYLELKNLPPVRDQGRFGLCYAHSSMLLLDHLRCSRSTTPAACYQEVGSVLHLARFQNTASENKIEIGGSPVSVLSRFGTTRNLSKENCAKYEDWQDLDKLYKKERSAMLIPQDQISESDYFYYISRQIKQNAATEEAKKCWAQEIVDAGIQHNVQDLMAIFNNAKSKTWQELRYEVLVPKSCLNQTISYPEFTQVNYPKYNEQKSFQGFRNFAYQVLKEGYPLEASFCSSKNGDGSCTYHTASITGQREVCDLNNCKLQFKMQNSYGKSWQQRNDNGWIDAKNLSDLMGDYSMGMSAILPKGKSVNTKLKAPYFETSPVSYKSNQVTLASTGNTVGSATDKCWKVDQKNIQYITEEVPVSKKPSTVVPSSGKNHNNVGKKGLWVCKGNGGTIYSDYAKDGMDCVEKKL